MLKLRYDLSIWESAMFGGGDDPALNFDGTSIYGELTHPVTFTGDFEIHIEFQLASGASGDLALIADASADNDWFRIDATNGSVDFKYNGVFVSTDGSFTPDTNTHTAKYKLTGSNLVAYYDDVAIGNGGVTPATITLGLVGKRSVVSNYFDGQIKSIKFIDKSGASDVIKTYQINNESTLYVPIAGGSLGSELVTNGGFDTDSDWNKGTGWTISGGVGVSDGANGNQPLHQTLTLVDGEPYLFGTTMNLTSGRVVIEEIGAATQTHLYTTSGVQRHTFIADQVSTILVHRSNNGNPYDGTVDNTTVKALPESIILYNVESTDWT